MRLRVLGCSGGIGSGEQTTALLLDHDVLIDAGTGVGCLTIEEMVRIDHVFVTHAHLDHVASIPFLVDTVGSMRTKPITVHALQATLDTLQTHLFNWQLWPDFTKIPNIHDPYLRYEALAQGDTLVIDDRRITALPANHVVPTVGYHLDSGKSSLIFSADTTINDAFWPIANQVENLKYLIIESAFSNHKRDIAIRSKHLCPDMLMDELQKLTRQAEIFVTHLKPGEADLTMREIQQSMARLNLRRLENNQSFEF